MNEVTGKSKRGLSMLLGALGLAALLAIAVLAENLFAQPVAAAGVDRGLAHAKVAPEKTPTREAGAGERLIAVTGDGEVQVKADLAKLSFQIQVEGASSAAALTAYERSGGALVSRLKQLGVAEGDVALQPASASPAPPDPGSGADATVGQSSRYLATGLVTATIRDLPRLRDTVMESLRAGPGIGLSMLGYGLQNPEHAREEAMRRALDNARQRAGVVAGKLGVQVKEVVSAVADQPRLEAPSFGGKGGELAAPNNSTYSALANAPDVVVSVVVRVSYDF